MLYSAILPAPDNLTFMLPFRYISEVLWDSKPVNMWHEPIMSEIHLNHIP